MKFKLSLFLFLIFSLYFAQAQDLSRYPLTVKPKATAKRIIFYLSGDGGMNSFSQNLMESLSEKNYAIVSLDSKKYFWDQKTPDKMAQDLTIIIEHYLKTWNNAEFSIVGYSFGADAALFLTPRLSKELQAKLKSTILLSPSSSTDFVIKLTDMMGFGNKEAKYKTLPEVNKINSQLCFIFGANEDLAMYNAIPSKKNISKIKIPGSHKFDNDIQKVALTIQTGL